MSLDVPPARNDHRIYIPTLEIKDEVPVLLADLGDEDERVREFAEEQLLKADEDTAYLIVECLELTERNEMKPALCRIIRELAPKPIYAAPVLEKTISDPEESEDTKRYAIIALGQVARDKESSIKLLIQILRERSSTNNRLVIHLVSALSIMGPKAVKELMEISQNDTEDPHLKKLADIVLSQIKDEDYYDGLTELQDYRLISSLQELKAASNHGHLEILDLSKTLLISCDPDVLANAALLLSKAGKPAVPYLRKVLEIRTDYETDLNIVWALGLIKRDAGDAVNDLIKKLKYYHDGRKHFEGEGISAITMERFIIWALGEIRINAQNALPILKEMLEEEKDPNNLCSLKEAIKKIRAWHNI